MKGAGHELRCAIQYGKVLNQERNGIRIRVPMYCLVCRGRRRFLQYLLDRAPRLSTACNADSAHFKQLDHLWQVSVSMLLG